jgi:hypothetical protein
VAASASIKADVYPTSNKLNQTQDQTQGQIPDKNLLNQSLFQQTHNNLHLGLKLHKFKREINIPLIVQLKMMLLMIVLMK